VPCILPVKDEKWQTRPASEVAQRQDGSATPANDPSLRYGDMGHPEARCRMWRFYPRSVETDRPPDGAG